MSSLSRILNRLSLAGQDLVPLRTSGNLSIIFCSYLIMDMISVPGNIPKSSSITRYLCTLPLDVVVFARRCFPSQL